VTCFITRLCAVGVAAVCVCVAVAQKSFSPVTRKALGKSLALCVSICRVIENYIDLSALSVFEFVRPGRLGYGPWAWATTVC